MNWRSILLLAGGAVDGYCGMCLVSLLNVRFADRLVAHSFTVSSSMEVNWKPQLLFPMETKSASRDPQARDALVDLETGGPGLLVSFGQKKRLHRATLDGLRVSCKKLVDRNIGQVVSIPAGTRLSHYDNHTLDPTNTRQ
jgi:hypothetical protein